MNKEDFIQLINAPDQVLMQNTASLEGLVKVFPYCQLGHMFIAKAHVQEGSMLSAQKVKRAAVYAVSREKLKSLLQVNNTTATQQAAIPSDEQVSSDQPGTVNQPVEEIPDTPVIALDLPQSEEYILPETDKEHLPVSNENTNMVQQITEEVESTRKKNKQVEIIDNFIKSQPRIMPVSPAQKEETNSRDLSENSQALPVSVASENLAKIMIKQGKTDKAIKIYEQLILKNPEKKSYFASQIENLKNK